MVASSHPKVAARDSRAIQRRKIDVRESDKDCPFSDGNASEDDYAIHIPQRITLGKGSNPVLHMIFVVGFLVFLLNISIKAGSFWGNIKLSEEEKKNRRLVSPVKRLQQNIERKKNSTVAKLKEFFTLEGELRRDIGDCGLYLGSSSIPNSGWGMFAGRDYLQGETIRMEYGYYFSPPRSTYHDNVPSEGDAARFESKPIKGIPPLSFLLKPHSVLSNVRWDSISSQEKLLSSLTATRDIKLGEELFLSWDDHPYRPSSRDSKSGESAAEEFDYVFAKRLPSLEDFLQADILIRDAQTQYFGVRNAEETNNKKKPYRSSNARWNKIKNKSGRKDTKSLYKSESEELINNGLQLWQKTVSHYAPLVARLLPTKAQVLATYHQKSDGQSPYSSLLGSLKNHSMFTITNAQCMSSPQWQSTLGTGVGATHSEEVEQSCASSSVSCTSTYKQTVAKKNGFAKGGLVTVVPLLVYPYLQAGENNCLALSKSLPPSLQVSICPLNGVAEYSNDQSLANVEYRWSNSTLQSIPLEMKSWLTKSPLPSFISLSLEEKELQRRLLLEEYPLSMSWDLVALRDLEQNEEIVVYQPDSIPFVVSELDP